MILVCCYWLSSVVPVPDVHLKISDWPYNQNSVSTGIVDNYFDCNWGWRCAAARYIVICDRRKKFDWVVPRQAPVCLLIYRKNVVALLVVILQLTADYLQCAVWVCVSLKIPAVRSLKIYLGVGIDCASLSKCVLNQKWIARARLIGRSHRVTVNYAIADHGYNFLNIFYGRVQAKRNC